MSQVQPIDTQVSPESKQAPIVSARLTPAPVAPVTSLTSTKSTDLKSVIPSTSKSSDFVKAEEFRKFIEIEILNIIKDLVERQEVTQEVVQAIAKQTLELITPGMTLEQLYNNAVKLDDTFSQLAPLIVKIMQEYEEKYEKKALAEVSKLIKNGDYNAAQDMVKKVLQFKAFS